MFLYRLRQLCHKRALTRRHKRANPSNLTRRVRQRPTTNGGRTLHRQRALYRNTTRNLIRHIITTRVLTPMRSPTHARRRTTIRNVNNAMRQRTLSRNVNRHVRPYDKSLPLKRQNRQQRPRQTNRHRIVNTTTKRLLPNLFHYHRQITRLGTCLRTLYTSNRPLRLIDEISPTLNRRTTRHRLQRRLQHTGRPRN